LEILDVRVRALVRKSPSKSPAEMKDDSSVKKKRSKNKNIKVNSKEISITKAHSNKEVKEMEIFVVRTMENYNTGFTNMCDRRNEAVL